MELGGNSKVRDYIEEVCSKVRLKEVHKEIALEIENHITELAEEYINQGFFEGDAINKAVADMGDALAVGNQLNRIHKPKIEWSILVLTLLFSVLGFSANYLIAVQGASEYSPYSVFIRSISFSLMGIALAAGLYFFDYRKLQPYSKYLYMATLAVMLFTISVGGRFGGIFRIVNGTVYLSSILVQICPLVFVVTLAGMLDNWDWNSLQKVLYSLVLLVIPIVVILASFSFVNAVIYSIAFLVVAFISGAKLRYILGVTATGAGMFLFAIFSKPYRVQRFFSFLNLDRDPLGSGYVNVQLNKVLQSAGFWGQGFTFKPRVLPEVHTDFIFAFIVYTFGWAAGILLVALFISFIIRIARLAGVVKSSYGKLLLGGFTAVFTVQFLWNVLMVMGLAPISGTGLPFISYGGTQFVFNMVAVGLILSIYNRRNIKGIA